MKKPRPQSSLLRSCLLTASVAAAASSVVHGEQFIWDADTDTAGAQDGSGTWSTASTNWWDGSANSTLETPVTRSLTLTSNSTTATAADATGLSVGQSVSGNKIPVGTTITAISGNTITLSQPAYGGGGENLLIGASDAVFGAGEGAAGTVNVSGTNTANSLTFGTTQSGNYVLDGGTIIAGGNNGGSVVVNQSATIQNAVSLQEFGTINVAQNQKLTLSSTSTANNSNGGFLGSGGNIPSLTGGGTVELTAGRFTVNRGGQIIQDGHLAITGTATMAATGLQVGWGAAAVGTGGSLTVDATYDGTNANLALATQLTIGRNWDGVGVGTVTVDSGLLVSAHSGGDAAILVGRSGGIGSLEVNGGELRAVSSGARVVLNSNNGAHASASGSLVITGGVTQIADLVLNGGNQAAETSSQGSSTVEMSGGELYIGGTVNNVGAGGLRSVGTGSSTYSVEFSGGTLGANADFSSNANLTLVSGTTTLKAANQANAARNITFNAALTGNGGFSKTGDGTVTLNAANNYSGTTTVSAGTLALGASGTVGTGGVALSGGLLDVSAKSESYALNTLTGSGSVTGDLTISTTLSIGNSPGTVVFNDNLTLDAASASIFEFSDSSFTAGSFDLALGGDGSQTVAFGGALSLMFDSNETYANGTSVLIFDFEGYVGGFDSVAFDGLGAGQQAVFDAGTGYVSVIPEPSIASFAALLGMLSIFRRRR